MRQLSILLFVVVAIGSTAYTDDQLLPTNLRITVLDELGNIQEGATVTLYNNDEDYRAEKNPVVSSTTDKKGRVTFKKLDSKSYFVHIVKDDMNNDGGGVQVNTLEPGKLNKINIVIR